MSPLFRLLGPVRLDGAARTVTPSTHLRRGLLTLLTTRPNRTISTEHILTVLWDRPSASARSNLRTQLAGLRKDLDGAVPRLADRIEVTRSARGGGGGGIRLTASEDEVDFLTARGLLDSARRYLRTGADPEVITDHCQRALSLWRGDPGTDIPATSFFGALTEDIRRIRLSLLETLCTAKLLDGRMGDELGELATTQPGYPHRESLWRIMIAAPVFDGDVSASLAAFERCRDTYTDAGLDLPETLTLLHRPLLDHDVEVVRDLLRAG